MDGTGSIGSSLDTLFFHNLEWRATQSSFVATSFFGNGCHYGTDIVFDRVFAQGQGVGGFVRLECLLSSSDTDHDGHVHHYLSSFFASHLAGLGILVALDFWDTMYGALDEFAFCTSHESVLII